MKRSAALFLTILMLIFTFSSCGAKKERPSCRELLNLMTQAEISLPSGRYYNIHAGSGENEYLSKSLLSALFGGSFPTLANDWLDIAVFLSLGESPCEFAVILNKNIDVAEDTAKLLSLRLSAIKTAKSSPQYAKMLESARVTVVGNYTLLIISEDPETALKIFLKNI